MCEERCKNPEATEYTEKFKDCQILIIREALRRFKKYSSLSNFCVAEKISGHTGLEVGHDIVDRFLRKGRLYRPSHMYVQAIVRFLLSRKANYELKPHHLEVRQDGYHIPTDLTRFFLKRGKGTSSTDDEIDEGEKNIKYNELKTVYQSSIDVEEEIKSITLIIYLRKDGEFFEVSEFIEVFTKFNKRKNMSRYGGSGVILPEGYVLFLMKDIEFGYNQIIISSNKFNFYTTKAAPQEFFAVIRDKDINFYKCSAHDDYSRFCYIFGKTLTFRRQD